VLVLGPVLPLVLVLVHALSGFRDELKKAGGESRQAALLEAAGG